MVEHHRAIQFRLFGNALKQEHKVVALKGELCKSLDAQQRDISVVDFCVLTKPVNVVGAQRLQLNRISQIVLSLRVFLQNGLDPGVNVSIVAAQKINIELMLFHNTIDASLIPLAHDEHLAATRDTGFIKGQT